jgi:hypothetical protein
MPVHMYQQRTLVPKKMPMAADKAVVLDSGATTQRSGETTNAVVVVTGPVLHSATMTASSRNRTGREQTL